MIEPPAPPAPPILALQDDVMCVGCGYDLRGLGVDGRCPECGTAVAATLNRPPPRARQPRWLAAQLESTLYLLIAIGCAEAAIFAPSYSHARVILSVSAWYLGCAAFWRAGDPAECAQPQLAAPPSPSAESKRRRLYRLVVRSAAVCMAITPLALWGERMPPEDVITTRHMIARAYVGLSDWIVLASVPWVAVHVALISAQLRAWVRVVLAIALSPAMFLGALNTTRAGHPWSALAFSAYWGRFCTVGWVQPGIGRASYRIWSTRGNGRHPIEWVIVAGAAALPLVLIWHAVHLAIVRRQLRRASGADPC